jgi:hypothetical protein
MGLIMLSQVNICHANVDASIPLSLANSRPMTSPFSGRCLLKESSSAARVILRWTRADHEEIEIYEGAGFILRQGEKGTAVDEIVAKRGSARRKKYAGSMPSEIEAPARPKAILVDQGTEFVSRGTFERALVSEPRRRAPKMRGLT